MHLWRKPSQFRRYFAFTATVALLCALLGGDIFRSSPEVRSRLLASVELENLSGTPETSASCIARTLAFNLNLSHQDKFRQQLDSLDEESRRRIRDLTASLEFIDYTHQTRKLVDAFANHTDPFSQGIHLLYEESPKFMPPAPKGVSKLWMKVRGKKPVDPGQQDPRLDFSGVFGNFQKALETARDFAKEPSIDRLKTIHRRAMAGGFGTLQSVDQIGEFRDSLVVGLVRPSDGAPLTDQQIALISENRYLRWQEQPGPKGEHYGQIEYPSAKNLKPELLQELEASHADLVAQVRAFQKSGLNTPATGLDRRVVTALTERLLQWFVKQKELIEPLDSPEKVEQFVELAARFQRDFISIHPFADGNGRTSRAMLQTLLESKDIPFARLRDPDQDYLVSENQWIEAVKTGIMSTNRLQADLAERIHLGLPLEQSPELLYPDLPSKIPLQLKVGSGAHKPAPGDPDPSGLVMPRQFVAYLRQRLSTEPQLRQTLQSKDQMEKLKNEFVEFEQKYNFDYIHKKEGRYQIGLNFVDEDFKKIFGRALSADSEAWSTKMSEWFIPELNWRGLSHGDRDVDETEIVGMFKEIHPQMTSNEVARQVGGKTPDQIRELALKDFDRYNNDLYRGDVYKMAKDHSETGPMYGQSYGYSTSKNRTVGKAFAMGAMVFAKYGEHATPEVQAKIKSRILIGAYRGKKDIDLGRLHSIDERFLYKYPRQQEVMGIGAADPDSTMVVQKIGPDGGVLQSYVRDPEHPDHIWVVEGQWPASDAYEITEPPAENLKNTISLWPAHASK